MKSKKILIIYTGGTIGMAASPQGYIPTPGLLTKTMKTNPAFHHPDMPQYDILEYSPLIDSANMSPQEWEKIAKDILQHASSYDGFIVLHGTDTMVYSASALSFLLRGLNKPVIFTGSQVPLVEVHTDARENLINALLFAVSFHIPEVCVFFNNQLFRGNRCQKINTNSFHAFSSPNYPPLGEVGLTLEVNEKLLLPPSSVSLNLISLKPVKLAVFTLFPGFLVSLLPKVIDEGLQGIVLRTYGVGNAPITHPGLVEALEYAQKKNVLIMNSTQCPKGRVDMTSYLTGKLLLDYGVLSSYDMTLEATLCKLYYAFSITEDKNRIKNIMEENLAGEFTK